MLNFSEGQQCLTQETIANLISGRCRDRCTVFMSWLPFEPVFINVVLSDLVEYRAATVASQFLP